MSRGAIGATSELTGASAVVITLAVLIFQLRQNNASLVESNRLIKVQAADNYDDVARWRDYPVRDPKLALWHAGCAGDPLDDVAAERFFRAALELAFGLRRGYERARATGSGRGRRVDRLDGLDGH